MRIKRSELLELVTECITECCHNGQLDIEIMRSPKMGTISNNVVDNVLKSLGGRVANLSNYEDEEDDTERYEDEEDDTERYEEQNKCNCPYCHGHMKTDKCPYCRCHMKGNKTSSGRMLDYGNVKTDSEEGRMTKQNLFVLLKHANELYDLINHNDDLPEWVQEKVASAKEKIQAVNNYLSYKINSMSKEDKD